MEVDDYQSPCALDEYFDGVEDKCIPCANVCTKEPLTFCKNNCPEFYLRLTAETYRSIVDTSRTTFEDFLSTTTAPTEPSPISDTTSRSLTSTQAIPLTTLLAMIAAVIAVCVAVVAFVLIWKERRRERYYRRSHDTENPLLHRTESDSICKSSSSASSSSNGNSLNTHDENSKTSLGRNSTNPPDVARSPKAGDADTAPSGCCSSSGTKQNRCHTSKACDGVVCDEASGKSKKKNKVCRIN